MMSPDSGGSISDAEFDDRLRARVQRLDELVPAGLEKPAPLPRVSVGFRGPAGLGMVTVGIGLFVVLLATAGLRMQAPLRTQAPGGLVTPTDTSRPTPVVTMTVPVGAVGLSPEEAIAAARTHVLPDAVLIGATAGRLDSAFVPLGPNGQLPPDLAPSRLVWVVTFATTVVICPPPYATQGDFVGQPCYSPRPGSLEVVLDYANGAFLQSAGFAPAPAVPTASAPGEVTETRGGVTFTRPASWFGVEPPEALVPGPYWWLSSDPLSATCPMTSGFPVDCLPGGRLRDGGIVIVLSSGATLARPAPTPLPVETLVSDACTRAGGHAVATRVGITYIDACLRGQAAEAAFEKFFQSLIQSTK